MGRMDTCMCMAESLCCSPETITTLLIGCIPIHNKKLQKKKKKRYHKTGSLSNTDLLSHCPGGWKFKMLASLVSPKASFPGVGVDISP